MGGEGGSSPGRGSEAPAIWHPGGPGPHPPRASSDAMRGLPPASGDSGEPRKGGHGRLDEPPLEPPSLPGGCVFRRGSPAVGRTPPPPSPGSPCPLSSADPLRRTVVHGSGSVCGPGARPGAGFRGRRPTPTGTPPHHPLGRLGKGAMVLPAALGALPQRPTRAGVSTGQRVALRHRLAGARRSVAVLRGFAQEDRFVLFVRNRDAEKERWDGSRMGPAARPGVVRGRMPPIPSRSWRPGCRSSWRE